MGHTNSYNHTHGREAAFIHRDTISSTIQSHSPTKHIHHGRGSSSAPPPSIWSISTGIWSSSAPSPDQPQPFYEQPLHGRGSSSAPPPCNRPTCKDIYLWSSSAPPPNQSQDSIRPPPTPPRPIPGPWPECGAAVPRFLSPLSPAELDYPLTLKTELTSHLTISLLSVYFLLLEPKDFHKLWNHRMCTIIPRTVYSGTALLRCNLVLLVAYIKLTVSTIPFFVTRNVYTFHMYRLRPTICLIR